MTRRISCLLAATLALTLSGCSYLCHFEARGVIRDATDGRPIPNARVELLDTDGKPLPLVPHDMTEVKTDPQGQFQFKFQTLPSSKNELTGWTLKLSAEGYESESIAVGPVLEPKRSDVTAYMVFHVALRKTK